MRSLSLFGLIAINALQLVRPVVDKAFGSTDCSNGAYDLV